MTKKKLLGEIAIDDKNELFMYKNLGDSIRDLKRTLDAPNPIVKDMLDMVSIEKINDQLKKAETDKNTKFKEIYNKYSWMQVADSNELVIMDDGKTYWFKKKCNCQDSSLDKSVSKCPSDDKKLN